jgi:hypothetical protein
MFLMKALYFHICTLTLLMKIGKHFTEIFESTYKFFLCYFFHIEIIMKNAQNQGL